MIRYNYGILKLVSEETGVPLKMIQGDCRKRGIVMARDLYINVLYRCLMKTEDEISRTLTIKREAINRSKARHESRMKLNKLYKSFYESIKQISGFGE